MQLPTAFEAAFAAALRDTFVQERCDALKLDAREGGFQVEPHGEIFLVVGTASDYTYDMYAHEERAERVADLMQLAARGAALV